MSSNQPKSVHRPYGGVSADERRDERRRRLLDERQATINAARASAQSALQEAKKAIEADVQSARVELERSRDTLANDIAEAILAGTPTGPGNSPGREAR